MREYYNLRNQQIIKLSEESCDLDTWNKIDSDIYSCWKHPNGFYGFLNRGDIKNDNEYNVCDPYGVFENMKSNFHERRINCTLDLLGHLKNERNLKLLDLGCGQGHITAKIKMQFNEFEISGLDHSISAIDFAHSNFKGIDFVVADAYSSPYCNEYFDVIVCNNLWEHVPDPMSLLYEIKRILKSDGLLIISTPSRFRITNILRVCLGKKVTFMSDQHVTEYTVGQIIEQLRFGGFEIKKIYSPPIREKRIIVNIIKTVLNFILNN
jgi:2-polyprenyl-3-methyl-5-hydroxy-6-metoxy-1,4-benzoquinol methylase